MSQKPAPARTTARANTQHAFSNTLKNFTTASGKAGKFFALPALAKQFPNISRLPVSLRIVLESVLRNCDGKKVTAEQVAELACWQPNAERTAEIAFVVSRVVLQDFTGVPLLADLAAMRSTAVRLGRTPGALSRWCQWTWWWTTRSWSTTMARKTRST